MRVYIPCRHKGLLCRRVVLKPFAHIAGICHAPLSFLSLVVGCGDVKKNQLVGPLLFIRLGALYRVPGVPKLDKADALYNTAVFYIKAWYDAFGEHGFG